MTDGRISEAYSLRYSARIECMTRTSFSCTQDDWLSLEIPEVFVLQCRLPIIIGPTSGKRGRSRPTLNAVKCSSHMEYNQFQCEWSGRWVAIKGMTDIHLPSA